jgi:predicted RNase H-like nuclease
MKFLGIDFGWQGKPSGLASLDWNGGELRLAGLDRLAGFDEILDWVDRESGGAPAMVAVDAPTVVRNPTGMRNADRLMHVFYGKHHAGAYPANLGRPHAERTIALGAALEQRGFRHADKIVPREAGRYQIEVHPHAATIELFNLPRIVKYKKGLLADRRKEFARYRRLMLERLPALEPKLAALVLPAVPRTGPLLKDVEDRTDAVLCAYIGAHWWYWGAARNRVVGSKEEGYIVVPAQSAPTPEP